MGVLTDFFVASEDELKMIFDGWLPVASEKYREFTNPQTGEVQLDWGPDPDALKRWEASQREVSASQYDRTASRWKMWDWLSRLFRTKQASPEVRLIDFSMLPHVCFKGVDLVRLSTLCSILTGLQCDDALEQILKPALIDPLTEDEGLHCIPLAFTKALAELDNDDVRRTAREWFQSEESELDWALEANARSVIKALAELAKKAVEQGKSLYYWWSL